MSITLPDKVYVIVEGEEPVTSLESIICSGDTKNNYECSFNVSTTADLEKLKAGKHVGF